MAVVAKRQEVKEKKYSHLKKIYSEKPKEKADEKEDFSSIKSSIVNNDIKKLTRKELLKDLALMSVIVGIGFLGYLVARFV